MTTICAAVALAPGRAAPCRPAGSMPAIAWQKKESARLVEHAEQACSAKQIHAALGTRDMPHTIRSLPSSMQIAPLMAAWDSVGALPARSEAEQVERQRAAAAVIHAAGQLAPRHAEHILELIWDRVFAHPDEAHRDRVAGLMERAAGALPCDMGQRLKASFNPRHRRGPVGPEAPPRPHEGIHHEHH